MMRKPKKANYLYFLLHSSLIMLLPLQIVYYLATQKNQGLNLHDPNLIKWADELMHGTFNSAGSSNNFKAELFMATCNSIKIITLILICLILLCSLIGLIFHTQRHWSKLLLFQLSLLSALSLIPPFTIYYLLDHFNWTNNIDLTRNGHIFFQFKAWLLPLLIFSIFNTYFLTQSLAVKDTLDTLMRKSFIPFYKVRGANFLQILAYLHKNWFLPIIQIFCYFMPYIIAESIIIEFLFEIHGLGKMLWFASEYNEERKAVRVFTPRLLTLTLIFTFFVQLTRCIPFFFNRSLK